MDIQSIKLRFGIIGSASQLDRAISTAVQVAPTDISVLITGESGVGKEVFPQIIHQQSARKHGPYIAVNCGAIPEGTIDSELFGHEKGAFTGAHDSRKGYFEVVDGGTIFLDEVAELPLSTQVRLLRVLETGEFIRVGSSKVIKTNVRVVAATNVNIQNAIAEEKFREDLYYRLNTVPIFVPPLRERGEDIILLFRKFAADFAEKYRMPVIRLDDEAKAALISFRWPGNVRQLKNITEQISIIEQNRDIDAATLRKYLPQIGDSRLPVLFRNQKGSSDLSERDILYKVLFDMRSDITELKRLVFGLMQGHEVEAERFNDAFAALDKYPAEERHWDVKPPKTPVIEPVKLDEDAEFLTHEVIEESLSLQEKEMDLIIRALEKHRGRRKNAARELGISERTLYRKIKEYGIEK